jgi:SAM-dependent methyltransferase
MSSVTIDPSDRSHYSKFMAACAASPQVLARWGDDLSEAERDFVSEELVPGHVLVAGSGHGRGIELLLSLGCQVTAVDREPLMCERVRSGFAGRGLAVIESDLVDLGQRFAPGSFDSVLCLGLVSGGFYLPGERGDAVLSAMVDCLRLDGVLLMDFLDGAPGLGRVQEFQYALDDLRTVPGLCYWPGRKRVLSDLAVRGLRARTKRMLHEQSEPLTCLAASRDKIVTRQ